MSSVHHVYPRFLCRLAATDRCAGAPAPPGVGRSRNGSARISGRQGRLLRRGRLAASLFFLVGAIAGCGDAPDLPDPTVDRSLRFDGAAPSLEHLGEEVLTAFTRSDTAALERVRLTEVEHNEEVWPELPVSAPKVNFPVDYAWQNIQQRNRVALKRTLPLYRHRTLAVRGVECRGTPESFETFEVLTDCWLVFDDRESGVRWEAQLFKDVIERGGGYKVFRYYDEDPRPHTGATGP